MIKYIALFLFQFHLLCLAAQEYYLTTVNIQQSDSDNGWNIIADSGGYLIMSASIYYGNSLGGIGLVKTDTEGQKLWEKSYTAFPFDAGVSDIISANTGYLISGTKHTPDNKRLDWHIKINETGDSIWTTTYGYAQKQGPAYPVFTGNNFIAFSTYGQTNEFAHRNLIHFDTSGYIINEYEVDDTPGYVYNYASEFTILPSGEYILGITYQNQPQQIYAAIRKTDTIGNTIWERMVNNLAVAQPVLHLSLLQDGNFVVSWVDLLGGETENRGSYFVRCYNAEGDSLWQYTFASIDYGRNIQDLHVCSNGDIIGCGYTGNFDITGNVTCWMFRLSAAGELLWIREYVYWDAYAQLMFLYGITEDPYGNIVATGYAVAPNEEGVLDEQAVLLKVNNMGCLSADCNDDIIINSIIGSTAAAVPPAPQASALQLYPNPMQEQATLVLPNQYAQKPVTVQLFNASGQMALQTNSNGKTQVQINKGNLPAGIYICKAFTQNNFIGTAKLLLE